MFAWSLLPPREDWGEGEREKTFGFSKNLLLMTNLFKKALTFLAILAIGVSCYWPLSADEPKPTKSKSNSTEAKEWHWPKVTISKETTYFTEPLRPDGGIDYVAAFNQRYLKGVTPENNAAVAFWRAVGPKNIDKEIRKRYFEMLGIAALPEEGVYFVDEGILPIWEEAKKQPDQGEAFTKQFYQQYDAATKAPWSKNDYPLWAEFLKRNEKPLQIFVDGMKRPRLYFPLVPYDDAPILMGCADSASHSAARAAMRLLTIRATLQLYEDNTSDAWQDIMTLYRLGRLESRQPSAVNLLVGYSAQHNASNAVMVLSQHKGLTASQAKECLKQLQDLPPMRPYWEICNELERCCWIELLMALVDTRDTFSFSMIDRESLPNNNPKSTRRMMAIKQLVAKQNTDCTELLLRYNAWRNRLVEVCRCPTGVEAFEKLAMLETTAKHDAKHVADLVLSGKPIPGSDMSPKEKAQHIVALATLAAQVNMTISVVQCEKENQTRENMALVTLALAGYRADHQGRYPKTLAELMPAYIDTLPKDLFTGDNLHYQTENGGYRLYSVGRNGKDDGGHNSNDKCDALGGHSTSKEAEAWDDIVFCAPLGKAEQKPNKAK